MRFWIIAIALVFGSFCWAAPDNMTQQTSANPPTITTSAGYTEEMTYPYVPNRPLTAEESRFLATFPEWVGKFAIKEATRQMLLAKEVHPNSLGYDPTGKDPARNALHYTEMYQSWWAPRAVRIPVCPSPPALGDLVVNASPMLALPGVTRISLAQGKACLYDLQIPACRKYREQICTIPVPVCAPTGLVNPGLRLPTQTVTTHSYTGAAAFWWTPSGVCPPDTCGDWPGPGPHPPQPPPGAAGKAK